MVSFSSAFVFIVLFAGLNIGLETSALRIVINEDRVNEVLTQAIHISCVTDGNQSGSKEIVVMEILREDGNPVAFIRPQSTVTYGANVDKRRFHAVGNIEKDVGKSYLNLTLTNPRSQDTGIYTCVMFYLDGFGQFKNIKVNGNVSMLNLTGSLLSLEQKMNLLEKRLYDLTSKEHEDQNNMADKVTSLEGKINDLAYNVNYTIAFSAEMDKTIIASNGMDLVFPKVIMNLGQGYNPNNGIFTAPISGLYAFHLVIMTCSGCRATFHITTASNLLAKLYLANRTDLEQSSVSSVTLLKPGDIVKITAFTPEHTDVSASTYSMFTGYLLKTQ